MSVLPIRLTIWSRGMTPATTCASRPQRLAASYERQDISAFVEDSFNVMRAAYPFADNPYLQETVENLHPAIRRTTVETLEKPLCHFL